MAEQNVQIIGNLNIDLIIRKVPDIPLWGQEVLGTDYGVYTSGQSAYTAFALSKLNIGSKIVSCVGDDLYGRNILNELNEASIDTSEVKVIENGRTGITVAIVRGDGERAFVSDPSSLEKFDLTMATEGMSSVAGYPITCILGNFFMPGFSLDHVSRCFRSSRDAGSLNILDTGWDSGNWQPSTVKDLKGVLRYVDFFIPNLDEAMALTREKSAEKAAEQLISEGCGTVVIKLGEEGSYLLSENASHHVPAFPTEVHDAVGAGDVFNAGFIYGTLHDWPLEARMIFGSAISSRYISRKTDRYPTSKDVLERIGNSTKFSFEEMVSK